MKLKSFNLHKLIENKRYAVLLSLFLSIILWFIIAMTFSQTTDQIISNVAVDLSGQSETMKQMGLSIISDEPIRVSVKVNGERTVVGGLKASDIKVTPDIKGITQPGVATVQLTAERNTDEVFEIVSISPETVELNFNRISSVKVPIEIDIGDAVAEDGYTIQSAYCNPSEVTVSGPENEVSQVKSARVQPNVSGVLSATVMETCEVILLDGDGNVLESDSLTPDVQNISVTIPVLKTKRVPLVVDFINLPKGFKEEQVKYSLSNDTVMVAGEKNVIDKLDEIHIGYIDLSTVNLDTELNFEVTLPGGVVNLEQIENVTVTFDMTDMAMQSFDVSNINMTNKPSNYDVTLISSRITGVTLIGPSADIEAISAADIVADIDFTQINIREGQTEVKVSISVPSKGTIWAYGNYVAQIEVEEIS